jgi:Domain of unknown function (DUF4345)
VTPVVEKRLLQAVIIVACLVPLTAGPTGVWRGAGWMAHGAPVSADLDSHFRYMSGIFTGVGLAFLSCVSAIETKGARLRLLVAFVVLGGLARAFSFVAVGAPDIGNRFGLVMELVVTPLIGLWQGRFARRWAASSGA